jgi:hypothetical protein
MQKFAAQADSDKRHKIASYSIHLFLIGPHPTTVWSVATMMGQERAVMGFLRRGLRIAIQLWAEPDNRAAQFEKPKAVWEKLPGHALSIAPCAMVAKAAFPPCFAGQGWSSIIIIIVHRQTHYQSPAPNQPRWKTIKRNQTLATGYRGLTTQTLLLREAGYWVTAISFVFYGVSMTNVQRPTTGLFVSITTWPPLTTKSNHDEPGSLSIITTSIWYTHSLAEADNLGCHVSIKNYWLSI